MKAVCKGVLFLQEEKRLWCIRGGGIVCGCCTDITQQPFGAVEAIDGRAFHWRERRQLPSTAANQPRCAPDINLYSDFQSTLDIYIHNGGPLTHSTGRQHGWRH